MKGMTCMYVVINGKVAIEVTETLKMRSIIAAHGMFGNDEKSKHSESVPGVV